MYQMAAYCRLSKDDGENKISESIENQLKLIREYVGKSNDLKIADIYIDDGYSGLYFSNRPDFQRMMEDICSGKIQGVITKDISRLGREHIETSNYIERIFPSLNVRFIAILDNVDSVSHSNEELAQFKTLFNDMYSRDISKKIRAALTAQKKRGQFMSGFAPYGYQKDPNNKHRFIIDPQAAQTVRRIFSLYLSGYSRDGIAQILNTEKILSPSEYKRKVQKLNYTNACEKSGAKGWTYPTINVILRNRTYTGAMVQHKSEKISYKIDKYKYIPPKEQYIVENTHEPIISQDTFEQVQNLMTKRTRIPGYLREAKKVNPYAGILVCGDCGYNLQRVACRDGYECSSYHKKGNTFCCSHFIQKSILDEVVKMEIQSQFSLALKEKDKEDILKAADYRNEFAGKTLFADQQLEQLQKDRAVIQKYKMKIFENYVDQILSKEEFLSYKSDYEQQEKDILDRISQLASKKEQFTKSQSEYGHWIEKLIKYGSVDEVTREMVVELIDKILINQDMSIDILFKYQSPYADT